MAVFYIFLGAAEPISVVRYVTATSEGEGFMKQITRDPHFSISASVFHGEGLGRECSRSDRIRKR
jgi:hypothetical protein